MIIQNEQLSRPRPVTGPRAGGLRARWGSLRARRSRTGMILVSPAFALVTVFALFPLGFTVCISLTNWPLIEPYHFVGGRNYGELIHDPGFTGSVPFTLLYTAIVTVFRTAFFLPFVVGLATLSFMLLLELQPGSGAVNYVLSRLGLAHSNTAWTVHYGVVQRMTPGSVCSSRQPGACLTR